MNYSVKKRRKVYLYHVKYDFMPTYIEKRRNK